MREDSTWSLDVEWPRSGRQRVYDLAQPLEHGIPHHPAHPPFAFTLTKAHGEIVYPGGISASSELLTLGGHVGTHVDGLGHVSRDGRIHGGHDIVQAQSYAGGLGHGSIEGVTPFLAPGHLVDAPRLFGRALTPDDVISADHFESWFADRPKPMKGAVVLVRTGWDEYWTDVRSYLGETGATPGVDVEGAKWLSAFDVVAVGSDTIAFEKLPARNLPVHVHLLVECGIHIMEALNLVALSGAGVEAFFFIAAPLRIRGGTGSPIRPLAIVADDAG